MRSICIAQELRPEQLQVPIPLEDPDQIGRLGPEIGGVAGGAFAVGLHVQFESDEIAAIDVGQRSVRAIEQVGGLLLRRSPRRLPALIDPALGDVCAVDRPRHSSRRQRREDHVQRDRKPRDLFAVANGVREAVDETDLAAAELRVTEADRWVLDELPVHAVDCADQLHARAGVGEEVGVELPFRRIRGRAHVGQVGFHRGQDLRCHGQVEWILSHYVLFRTARLHQPGEVQLPFTCGRRTLEQHDYRGIRDEGTAQRLGDGR